MLTITNTTVEQLDTEYVKTTYNVTGSVELAGDSIWNYTGPSTVEVTQIDVVTDTERNFNSVYVQHNTGWRIYTDTGFESAISAALGEDCAFTEQGMQDDCVASLEY